MGNSHPFPALCPVHRFWFAAQVVSNLNRRFTGTDPMHLLRTLVALLSRLAFASSPASDQASFPQKPITLVVPFGAGGALDLIARVLADGLRNDLGQTVLVDNKPGASGLIGMR